MHGAMARRGMVSAVRRIVVYMQGFSSDEVLGWWMNKGGKGSTRGDDGA
jgi:hypothetical protein